MVDNHNNGSKRLSIPSKKKKEALLSTSGESGTGSDLSTVSKEPTSKSTEGEPPQKKAKVVSVVTLKPKTSMKKNKISDAQPSKRMSIEVEILFSLYKVYLSKYFIILIQKRNNENFANCLNSDHSTKKIANIRLYQIK